MISLPPHQQNTGYFSALMLIVCEISANKTLGLGKKKFPKDPAIIIVSPTKALEDGMAHFLGCCVSPGMFACSDCLSCKRSANDF